GFPSSADHDAQRIAQAVVATGKFLDNPLDRCLSTNHCEGGEQNDAEHNTAEDKGYWIKASISANGAYTISNARKNFSKSYTTR
ncbi:MAG: hypothetical protein ABI995_11965, partial [Acidobacteriota bacterium]